MNKSKILVLIVVVSLLLCSSFAAAGLSDMLTGKFSFGNLFRVKEAQPQQANIVVEPNCGDDVCVASESPETCPEDCGNNDDLEVVYADKIESQNTDQVLVQDELRVTSSGMYTPAVLASVVGSPMAIKGVNDNGILGEVGSNAHSAGVYGYGVSWANGVIGENENGLVGKLGTSNYGAYGKHVSSDKYGYLGSTDYGVYGKNNNNGNYGALGGNSAGVDGFSVSGSGVKGTTLGGSGIGVFATADSGKAMHAYALGTANYALHAQSVAPEGVAILAQTLSSSGYSGLFTGGQGVKIYGGGLCVDVDSNCDPDASGDGWVRARGYYTGNADIAEYFASKEKLEAGDVVVINGNEKIAKSSKAYDTSVAGIISTKPGVALGNEDDENLVALAGRVPAKVSAENGAIQIGDLLTTSSTPGYAMKCTDMQKCFGALVGKALEPLKSGKGNIVVLVTLG